MPNLKSDLESRNTHVHYATNLAFRDNTVQKNGQALNFVHSVLSSSSLWICSAPITRYMGAEQVLIIHEG